MLLNHEDKHRPSDFKNKSPHMNTKFSFLTQTLFKLLEVIHIDQVCQYIFLMINVFLLLLDEFLQSCEKFFDCEIDRTVSISSQNTNNCKHGVETRPIVTGYS